MAKASTRSWVRPTEIRTARGCPSGRPGDAAFDLYMELGDEVRSGTGLCQEACALFADAMEMWAAERPAAK